MAEGAAFTLPGWFDTSTARWDAGGTRRREVLDVSDPTPDQNPATPETPPSAPPPAAPPAAPAYGAPPAPSYGTPPAPAYGAPTAPPYGAPPAPPYGVPAPQYAAPNAPYGAPPAPYGTAPSYGYAPAPKTNTLAVVSLIASLVGVFLIPFIGQIVGIITGHMSLSQLKTSGEGGRGLALAGTIVGWVTIGLYVLLLVFIFVIIGFAAANGARYGYSS